MYDHVLLAVSPDAAAPLARGLEAARHFVSSGGRITALTVIEDLPGYVAIEVPEDVLAMSRERTVAGFRERLAGADDVETAIASGHAGRVIVEWASARAVGCVVIMSHRPGFSDLLLGSTAAWVVRHAPMSVHVLR
jgi:universal stress protein F